MCDAPSSKVISPELWLAALPMAVRVRPAGSDSTRADATAAPIAPQAAVGWKPRSNWRCTPIAWLTRTWMS
jgi:hypothetical protein